MSTGEVADHQAILAAADAVGAITLCDATQALGWLPLEAARFDAVVCSAYKWLMSPRGSALMAVSDRLLESAVPHSAGWYAGEDVHARLGTPLRWISRQSSPWSRILWGDCNAIAQAGTPTCSVDLTCILGVESGDLVSVLRG
jgi:hypothetical protein